jgi:hypothetical protein
MRFPLNQHPRSCFTGTIEAVGVTQPQKHGPFQIRLKFGKRAYCVAKVRIREDAADVAKKLDDFPELCNITPGVNT